MSQTLKNIYIDDEEWDKYKLRDREQRDVILEEREIILSDSLPSLYFAVSPSIEGQCGVYFNTRTP